jgi:hypothetical protein
MNIRSCSAINRTNGADDDNVAVLEGPVVIDIMGVGMFYSEEIMTL